MNTDKLEAIAKLRNKIQTISASIADLGTQRTHAKLELAALLSDIQVGDTITWGGGRKGVVSALLPTYVAYMARRILKSGKIGSAVRVYSWDKPVKIEKE